MTSVPTLSFSTGHIESTSEDHSTGSFGFLKLALHRNGGDWEFLLVTGGAFHDSGSAPYH